MKKEEERFVQSFVYALMAPLIGFPQWEDLLKDHKDRAIVYRLGDLENIMANKQATDFEAMLYLHTASLAAAMDHNFVTIYMFLFTKYYHDIIPEANKKELVTKQINDYQRMMLTNLKRWIFRQQMQHLKHQQSKSSDK